MKHFYSLVCLHKLKFKIWGRFDQWLLRYFTFTLLVVVFLWSSFLIKHFYNLVISLISLSFKFGEDPTRGCFAYIFHFWYLRSSSIWCHLHFKDFLIWFGHISLSWKFGEVPTSGCWDIAIWSWQFILYWNLWLLVLLWLLNLIGLIWIASWAAV